MVMRIEQLRFSYGPGPSTIHDLSVDLQPGRVCALVGPNAAGKSTLLRLMLGQLQPSSGSVTIEGREVSRLPAGPRAVWVSYVPQRSHAAFAFTAHQVVAMGRYALPANPAAIERAIEQNDLATLRSRVYIQLSAGQQQRVLIARAMAQAAGQGKVMLLDEPTSALDLKHVHQTMRTLAALAGSGLAVLVVVHDLNLAGQYADEVWLIHRGRLRATGCPSAVLTPEVLEPIYETPFDMIAVPGRSNPMIIAKNDSPPG